MIRWPGIVVGIAGALAFGGAFVDHDAFAVRAHSATVVLAFLVSLVAWVRLRRWVALLGFIGAKAAVVAIWLPHPGLAVLTMGYDRMYLFRDMLHWFWVVPPVLLAITLVESWVLSVYRSGRLLRDTAAWRRRYLLTALAVTATVVAVGWWLMAPRYYLWKVRTRGHGPQSAALQNMGPRVLPRLYGELDALGDEPVGEVRSTLVGIIQKIRYDMVARQTGSVLVTVVETTPAEVDTQMVAHLSRALAREPIADERRSMLVWLSELDYRTAIATVCAAFDEVPPDTWEHLVSMLGKYVGYATADVYEPGDSLYPWRGLSESEIAERKADILQHLQCAQPKLVDAIASHAADPASTGDFRPGEAARLLAAMGPLTDEQVTRLKRAYVVLDDEYAASEMLRYLGPMMAGDGEDALEQLATELFREAQTQAARNGVLQWISARPQPQVVHQFACDVFGDTPNEMRRELIHRIAAAPRPGRPACASDVLMKAVEQAADAPPADHAPGDWLDAAVFELRDQAPHEPRIRRWAKSVIARHGDAVLGTWYALLPKVAETSAEP